jgi:uncharacterized RDD family membrane protein YckC
MLGLSLLLVLTVSLRMNMPYYAHPQAVAAGEAWAVAADEFKISDAHGSAALLRVSPTLQPLGRQPLGGPRVRLLALPDATLAIAEDDCSLLRDGQTLRTVRFQIDGAIQDAFWSPDGKHIELIGLSAWTRADDPDRGVWTGAVALEELLAAPPGGRVRLQTQALGSVRAPNRADRIAGARTGDRLYVGWIDPVDRTLRIHTQEGPVAPIADVERFALVPADDGLLAITYRRRAVGFGSLVLGTTWIGPARERESGEQELEDDQLTGRLVTGIHAVPVRDGVLIAVTRLASVQALVAGPRRADLNPRTPLCTLVGQPAWQAAGALALTLILLACCVGLIYSGTTLFRQKRRDLARALKVRTLLSPYAGAWERGPAYFIDLFLLAPVITIAWDYAGVNWAALTTGSARDAAAFVLSTGAVEFGYFFLTELIWGRTLGKLILGLRVRSVDGARAGPAAILARNLLRPLEAGACTGWLGVVMILVTKRNQRWGDLLGRTVVVPTEELRRLDLEAAGQAAPQTEEKVPGPPAA